MGKTLRNKIASSILSDYLESGILKPGDALPTMRDLQVNYGVSSGTILNAIAILETQGIVVSRHGSGCYVAENGGIGKRNGAKTMGFVCNSRDAYIMMRIMDGADAICQTNGYNLVLASTNFDYEEEHRQVDRLVEAGCEGIVLYPVARTKEQLKNDYLNTEHLDIPIVLVDLALPGHKRSQVLLDNYRAGYDMTTLLLEKGHKRIAFMDYAVDGKDYLHRSIMDRYKGYLAAMHSAGIAVDPADRWFLKEQLHVDSTDSILEMLHNWIEQTDHPTALIAIEDNKAVLTLTLAQALGIKVTDELEIVGFDNLPVGRIIRPHITTSSPSFMRAGEQAMELVFQHIQGEISQPVIYMLPVPIKERETRSLERRIIAESIDQENFSII